MIYNQGKLNNFGTNGAPYFYAFCKSMSISEVVYFSSQYFFCSIMWMWSSYLRCSTTSTGSCRQCSWILTHTLHSRRWPHLTTGWATQISTLCTVWHVNIQNVIIQTCYSLFINSLLKSDVKLQVKYCFRLSSIII